MGARVGGAFRFYCEPKITLKKKVHYFYYAYDKSFIVYPENTVQMSCVQIFHKRVYTFSLFLFKVLKKSVIKLYFKILGNIW